MITRLFVTVFILSNFCSSTKKYGNKTFDEWTWLTAHNAHVNWEDSETLEAFTNQNFGIAKQLEVGVRGFMFDIDWKSCSSFEKFFGSCKCSGMILLYSG